ncbi:glycosyltransferase [Nodosilinea sp. E11]|uniref:glycosyltransferase n=1 Tax=Nodosilinea sp. E11 TaxID=3037479 RepID=UPI002934748A|nr:glycosyltransferase [Nodosilinea sp. E11]WOD40411.1 glycosyltransferase [Nodosilinea sp. E11]
MVFEAGRFPKVLAYVTAYQDEQSLRVCLDSIAKQVLPVTHILVVDNSPLPLLLPMQYNELVVIHCPENIGVGGGVTLALQQAINQGYDFVWLLDQDSQPDVMCLQHLAQVYQEQHCIEAPIAMVAPLVIDGVMDRIIGGAVFDRYRFKEYLPNWDTALWVECDAPIISGILIAIAAVKVAGLPQQELFMDGIDLEYGFRLKQHNFRNIIASRAILHHCLGNPLKVLFLGKPYFIQNYSIPRSYYYHRNHTHLEMLFSESKYKPWTFLWRCYIVAKDLLLTLLYRDQKSSRISACLIGTWHGFLGRIRKLERSS